MADLAALGIDVEGAFIYKGIVAAVNNLPTTGNKIGYVYHVTADDSEYVWTGEEWEEFGKHFLVSHTHTVTASGSNKASKVSGTITVTGSNSASAVTGSASIENAPSVSATAKYAKVSTANDTFIKSYPGATNKLVKTSIKPAADGGNALTDVTLSTTSITPVSGSTTASKATKGTAISVAKPGAAVSIPNVTGNSSVTASKVTPSTVVTNAVVDNGILTISFGQSCSTTDVTATNTTLGTAISVTPAVSAGSITPYTFTDVTVPVAATPVTLATGIATKESDAFAKVGTAVDVATGAVSSTGTGASILTGLGTPTTSSALISASLAAGTSSDGIHTGDDVTIGTQKLTGDVTGTAAAQTWTSNAVTHDLTAAAQVWTGSSVSTSGPVAS